ncbi:MAG: hypothetical protein LUD18_13595 [Lachnospiraceae bacterium]|nr:hypothetical protein [Lachnospiraceae bacterium]
MQEILPVLLLLAMGLLTGSALPGLLQMGNGNYAGLASSYSFRVFENLSTDRWEIFCYVVSVRMPVLLILWMSSFTTLGILFHLGYAWWIAASGAMLLALFGQQSGFGGIAQFGCCIFPQWIFYAILWKKEMSIWFRRGRTTPEWFGGSVRKLRRKDVLELVNLAALCLLGCACEAFLGTWMLRLYLRL